MALENHARITRLLERVKSRGLISEYLVSWTGRRGHLRPKVTVWHEGGCDRDKDELAQRLLGLVSAQQINLIIE